jgi:glycosyltransferase involved in cell wall biosynthesis
MDAAAANEPSPRAAVPVSVIIPNFNSGAFLTECIDSINECDPPSEIIVVDDGSSDESPELARSLAARWPNVRLFEREVNGGIVAARQDGLRLAAQEHVTFVDADDHLEPRAIRAAYEGLRAAGAEICIWQLWRSTPERQWLFIPLDEIAFPISGRDASILTLGAWRIHPLGVAHRKIWTAAYAGFSETYPNADELVTRLAFLNAATVACCDKRYFYRLHGESHGQQMHPRRLGILQSQLWLLRFSKRIGVDRQDQIVRFSVREALTLWQRRHELGAATTSASLRAFLKALSREVNYGKLLRRCPKHLLALIAMRIRLPFPDLAPPPRQRGTPT